MANRKVLLVSVALAGVALAVTPGNAAPAEEECISRPKGAAPEGKHWYYNTNRKTNRKCWFLADKGTKVVAPALSKQSAPKEQPVTAVSVDAEQKVDPPPTAEARAEFIDAPDDERTTAAAKEIEPEASPNATVGAAVVPGWAVASRWPDPSEGFSLGQYFMANELAPASRAESPSPAPAAPPVVPTEEASPAIGFADWNPAHFTALFLVAVVLGGVILTFAASRRAGRRHSFGQRDAPQSAFHYDARPMRPIAAMRQTRNHTAIAAE